MPGPDPEIAIRELAALQHGAVATAQALGAGLSRRRIHARMASGRFQSICRGVFRVGAVAAPLERPAAALLLCGETAVLSHTTALRIWLPPEPAFARPWTGDAVAPADQHDWPLTEVTRPGGGSSRMDWLRIHRVHQLTSDEWVLHQRLRVTTPARTLVDLASTLDQAALDRLLARLARARLCTLDDLERAVRRHCGRRGVGRLRRLVAVWREPPFTRSEAERKFLDVVRRARLPAPEANRWTQGMEVDFVWRNWRVAVEVDGWEFHSSRRAFETDRRRDAVLAAAGFLVLRFTWRQLEHESELVSAAVSAALTAARLDPRISAPS
jgi:very-short-patch-repair endonuclease